MVRITNISGGQLVCDLKDKSTLRLDNKKSCECSDKVITQYVKNLAKKGLIRLEVLKESVAKSAATPKKVASKESDESKGGN